MRDLTPAMQTALDAEVARICLLFRMEFGDNVTYLSSTPNDVQWNSQTWLGNGWLRPFSNISEVADISASGLKIRIGGLDSVAVSLILSELAMRNEATLYLGLLDDNLSVIADPMFLYNGLFDQAELRDNGVNSEIMLSYENERIRHQKANELRYNDQCQQALFPGDTGFRYASKAADWSGFWGKAEKVKFVRRRKTGRA